MSTKAQPYVSCAHDNRAKKASSSSSGSTGPSPPLPSVRKNHLNGRHARQHDNPPWVSIERPGVPRFRQREHFQPQPCLSSPGIELQPAHPRLVERHIKQIDEPLIPPHDVQHGAAAQGQPPDNRPRGQHQRGGFQPSSQHWPLMARMVSA